MSATPTQHEIEPRHAAPDGLCVLWRIAEGSHRASFLHLRVSGGRLEAALRNEDGHARPIGAWSGVEIRRDDTLTHIDLPGKFRATFRGNTPIYARTDLLGALAIGGGRAELVPPEPHG